MGSAAQETGVVYIYCLKDPETLAVRYVGMAPDPAVRFGTHLSQAKYRTTAKDLWLRSLGALPVLEVIAETPSSLGRATERQWIIRFASEGADLLNVVHRPRVKAQRIVKTNVEMTRVEPRGRNPFANVVGVPEAATMKGVAQSAVVRAINEGRLSAWTVGRMHFMRREDVEEWQPVRGRGRRKPEGKPDA